MPLYTYLPLSIKSTLSNWSRQKHCLQWNALQFKAVLILRHKCQGHKNSSMINQLPHRCLYQMYEQFTELWREALPSFLAFNKKALAAYQHRKNDMQAYWKGNYISSGSAFFTLVMEGNSLSSPFPSKLSRLHTKRCVTIGQ